MKNIQNRKKKLTCPPKPFYGSLSPSQYTSIISWGSVFNFWGNYYNENISRILSRPDEEVLKDDWGIIGQDINNSLKEESIEVAA
ncbi:MAG: hypothetical protein ACTHMV_16665 [Chitinophagaceae bacterium]